jgi:hypothetical protein
LKVDFSDLVGEVFLILLFLGMAIGAILAEKIRRKK